MDAPCSSGTAGLLALADLVELIQVDEHLFRSVRLPSSPHRLLGSGILAATLMAAAATTARELEPGSMHVTFARPGRHNEPVDIVVDSVHDGRTTSTRQVTMRQAAGVVSIATVRFADGHDDPGWHLDVEAEVPVDDSSPALAAMAGLPVLRDFDVHAAAAPADGRRIIHPYWVRYRHALPPDPLLHACLVAFLTDLGVSGSARPPGTSLRDRLGPVTLDHALWFHRRLRVDQWLLITADSLTEAGGRALARGEVATADGRLVASFAQEAMLLGPKAWA